MEKSTDRFRWVAVLVVASIAVAVPLGLWVAFSRDVSELSEVLVPIGSTTVAIVALVINGRAQRDARTHEQAVRTAALEREDALREDARKREDQIRAEATEAERRREFERYERELLLDVDARLGEIEKMVLAARGKSQLDVGAEEREFQRSVTKLPPSEHRRRLVECFELVRLSGYLTHLHPQGRLAIVLGATGYGSRIVGARLLGENCPPPIPIFETLLAAGRQAEWPTAGTSELEFEITLHDAMQDQPTGDTREFFKNWRDLGCPTLNLDEQQ